METTRAALLRAWFHQRELSSDIWDAVRWGKEYTYCGKRHEAPSAIFLRREKTSRRLDGMYSARGISSRWRLDTYL